MSDRTRKGLKDSDSSFHSELMAMLASLAERDPMKAARLFGAFLDDLAEEARETPLRARGA
jgi:hypothetical protein